MFVILLNYNKPPPETGSLLEEHRAFFERSFASGHFLVSGRRMPYAGGVILAKADSRAELEQIIRSDPYVREQLLEFEVIEFTPLMTAPDLAGLRGT